MRATLAASALIAALAAGCGGGHPRAVAIAAPPTTAAPTTTSTSTTAAPPEVPVSTLVATTRGEVPRFASPGGPPSGTIPASWYHYPTILPVIATQPGWLQVRLAQRPNGSTAWIQSGDATLSSTPYRIVLHLGAMHMVVFQAGQPILDIPAGIGTTTDPTVTGNYFVTMHAPPPSAGYGPLVLVTSAHSDAITDWEGMGDAIIAIHGPIDPYDDGLIGTTGARISHGCIRLHNSDLAQLAPLPPGTPIDIVAA